MRGVADANYALSKQLWDQGTFWNAQWQLFQSPSAQSGYCVPEVLSRWVVGVGSAGAGGPAGVRLAAVVQ
jgi:hypothetical protein